MFAMKTGVDFLIIQTANETMSVSSAMINVTDNK